MKKRKKEMKKMEKVKKSRSDVSVLKASKKGGVFRTKQTAHGSVCVRPTSSDPSGTK